MYTNSLGKTDRLAANSIEIAEYYNSLAVSNQKAANLLLDNGFYNESGYMYIQSMEKYVKEQICRKIDVVGNQYFAKALRDLGHRLDKSVEYLIEIYSGNDVHLKKQLTNQLINNVLKGINFSFLHNDLRYPFYNEKFHSYNARIFSKADCEYLKKMTEQLVAFMNDLYRIR